MDHPTVHAMAETTDRTLRALCDDPQCAAPRDLDALLHLAVQVAREGREGRRLGTLFTVGDAEAVRARSRPTILDPLAGRPPAARRSTGEVLPELWLLAPHGRRDLLLHRPGRP